MKPNISIVTAFFDIGRGNWNGSIGGRQMPPYLQRTTDQYFTNFERLLKLENDIVVFTSADLESRFDKYKEQKSNLSVICFDDWKKDLFPEIRASVEKIQSDPNFYSMVQQPWNPEYWNTDYIMVNLLKSYFVNYAIDWELIDTELAAWIDFGYSRHEGVVPTTSWSYNFDPDKIHFFSIKKNIPHGIAIGDIIATNDVFIQGCHMVAAKKNWQFLMSETFKHMNLLLDNNLVDDDQTLLLMNYITNPDRYQIHYVDPSDWFIIFKEFNNAN